MAALKEHKLHKPLKMLLLGSSGSGKTSALASLAKDYKIKILDLDNGLDSLIYQAERIGTINNIDAVTVPFEKYKHTPAGTVLSGPPLVFKTAMNLLDKWDDESEPKNWGPDTVFVLDSLTRLGDGAFEWAKSFVGPTKQGNENTLIWYRQAQEAVMKFITQIMSDTFNANVILITHVGVDIDENGSIIKNFPTSIGRALGDKIPQFFNTVLLAEISGSGEKVRRTIRTVPTALLGLKNPRPDKLERTYPIEDGLAKIFTQLKEGTTS